MEQNKRPSANFSVDNSHNKDLVVSSHELIEASKALCEEGKRLIKHSHDLQERLNPVIETLKEVEGKVLAIENELWAY